MSDLTLFSLQLSAQWSVYDELPEILMKMKILNPNQTSESESSGQSL